MPRSIPALSLRATVTLLSMGLGVALLSGCSHDTPHQARNLPAKPAALVAVPRSAAIPQPIVQPVLDPVARFVSAFGHGELAVIKQYPGPHGLTAALVAPSGTKQVTPTTPAAVLWVLPGGKYAMLGTLMNAQGTNLTKTVSTRMGLIPPVISMPGAQVIAATASAASAASH